jgi:hypothetical protein
MENCCGGQDRLAFARGGTTAAPVFAFNDVASNSDLNTSGYIIEWSDDCNNDGLVDYGQILDGTFDDLNANGVPDCCEPGACLPCLADVIKDRTIDGIDLAAVLSQWGSPGSSLFSADIDDSGLVDGADLAAVLSAWGPCPD